jgi:hypothetical protein
MYHRARDNKNSKRKSPPLPIHDLQQQKYCNTPKIQSKEENQFPFFQNFEPTKTWIDLKIVCIVFMHECFDVAMIVVWSVGNTSAGSKKSKTNKKKNKDQGTCDNGHFGLY